MDCVWRIQNDMKVVSSLVPCLSFQNKGIVCSVNDQVVSMVTTPQYIYNRYNLEYLCKKRFLHPLYYQGSLSQSHKRTRAPLQFSLTPPTHYPRVDNFHHGESLLRYIEPLYLTLASEIRDPMIYVPSVSRRNSFYKRHLCGKSRDFWCLHTKHCHLVSRSQFSYVAMNIHVGCKLFFN